MQLVNKSRYTLQLHAPRGEDLAPPCDSIRLLPTSRTEVDPDQWKQVKAHPGTKRYLKAGFIVEVKGKAKTASVDTSGESLRDALEYIGMATDVEELQAMAAADDREEVQIAIEKRMLALAKG